MHVWDSVIDQVILQNTCMKKSQIYLKGSSLLIYIWRMKYLLRMKKCSKNLFKKC